MPTGAEIGSALRGVRQVALGDPQGMRNFDLSADGFWNSFFAAVLLAPVFVLAAWADYASYPPGERPGAPGFALLTALAYLANWAARPLIMLPVTRWLGLAHRYVALIVTLNWSTLPADALLATLTALTAAGLLPLALGGYLQLLALLAVLFLFVRIVRTATEAETGPAMAIVALDLLAAFLIAMTRFAIIGTPPA